MIYLKKRKCSDNVDLTYNTGIVSYPYIYNVTATNKIMKYLLVDFVVVEGDPPPPVPAKASKEEDDPFLLSLGLLPDLPNIFLDIFSYSLASHSNRAFSSSSRLWSIRSASKNVRRVSYMIKINSVICDSKP